jgi:dGTPase
MMLREDLEKREFDTLSQYAARSAETKGRKLPEEPDQLRTEFQRDRDRIIHSKALRRLMHKTQVFLAPEGDHFRTRLTHTLEVAQIARTISRALRLNEDLTEAIAMGHDLGHTPFGHNGERFLDKKHPGGFKHNVQSLRVVDVLEHTSSGGPMNLTDEVRDGILNHSGEGFPYTLEGQVVRLSDRIAYINHDIDDALRGGIISDSDIPKECLDHIGHTHGERIDYLVRDIIINSDGKAKIYQSDDAAFYMNELRNYMFEAVYRNPVVKQEIEMRRVKNLIDSLYDYYIENPAELPGELSRIAETDGLNEAVKDFIAGMTDRYAIKLYTDLFVPTGWGIKRY